MPAEGRTTRRILYMLSFLVFFILGAATPALLGKLEGQGLAGSATVLLYGLLFSMAGVVGAYLAGLFVERRMLMRVNVFLLIVLVVMVLLLTHRYRQASQLPSAPALDPPPALLE